jgi:hypothetical protein
MPSTSFFRLSSRKDSFFAFKNVCEKVTLQFRQSLSAPLFPGFSYLASSNGDNTAPECITAKGKKRQYKK